MALLLGSKVLFIFQLGITIVIVAATILSSVFTILFTLLVPSIVSRFYEVNADPANDVLFVTIGMNVNLLFILIPQRCFFRYHILLQIFSFCMMISERRDLLLDRCLPLYWSSKEFGIKDGCNVIFLLSINCLGVIILL
jgi:hypothetical protein